MNYQDLFDQIPEEARDNQNHEFWGPSPDVRARNFKDPVRTILGYLLTKGEPVHSLINRWRQEQMRAKVQITATSPDDGE